MRTAMERRPKKPYRRPQVRSEKIVVADLFSPSKECVPTDFDPCPTSSGD
jgi:hypothetical protein